MVQIDPSQLVKAGELRKPYGIKGWLWLYSHLDDRDAIFANTPWYIKTAAGWQTITVEEWRTQGRGLVAKLAEVPDRTIAETMFGVPIWIDSDYLSELGEDEYYWTDLQGLKVYLNDGDHLLGTVTELFDNMAHPIIQVSPCAGSVDDQERLIPWHDQTIESVSLSEGRITVDWHLEY